MEGKKKDHRLIIGSVSIASAIALITVTIGPSLLLDREKSQSRNINRDWDIIVPDHYKTIREAIENAKLDYRIFIRSGNYRTSDSFINRPITIDKQGLTIHGENKETTIIDGRFLKNIVIIKANYVNFSGFTIKGYDENGSSIIVNSNNCIINDNILVGKDYFEGTEYCIRIDEGEKNIISNNTIFGTDNGIELKLSSGNIIENNIIYDNDDGIELENILVRDKNSDPKWSWKGNNGNIIQNNQFTNNLHGLVCYGSSENLIRNNTFNSNSGSGLYLTSCYNENIKNNTFIRDGLGIFGKDIENFYHEISGNTVNGKPLYYFRNERIKIVPQDAGQIILVDCDFATIEKVIITDSSTAVLVAFSNNVKIRNSEFTSNNLGIFLCFSTDCSIERNNFINNSNDATFEVQGFLNRKSNKWRYNYWDSWIGLKRPIFRFFNKRIIGRYHTSFRWLDRFGFGRRVKNIDRFPQKTPYSINP